MRLPRLRRRRVPTVEEIRAAQLADAERVLAEVDAGAAYVLVGDRLISAESAWAAALGVEAAIDLEGRFDGVEKERESGVWLARVEFDDGPPIRVGLGRFPDGIVLRSAP